MSLRDERRMRNVDTRLILKYDVPLVTIKSFKKKKNKTRSDFDLESAIRN